jgi:hypothetical protein
MVAKAKLKKIRSFYSNIAQDSEEQQRFSAKIMILLLTMGALEANFHPLNYT